MNSPVKIWRNQKHIARMLGREGNIISWTVVRVPPTGFSDLAPYPVVIVEFAGGKRMTAQLVDWSEKDVAFGTRVKVVVRRVSEPPTEGVIPYGIKVKPL
jgi:uncharacterized OB-fold protein